jgi:hypothetical protein
MYSEENATMDSLYDALRILKESLILNKESEN